MAKDSILDRAETTESAGSKSLIRARLVKRFLHSVEIALKGLLYIAHECC
jgi:hypothetical protein